MKSSALIALLVVASSSAAFADTEPTQAAPAAIVTLSDDDLDATRGGQETNINAVNRTTLSANNSGNSVNAENVTTGTVSIGADAFSGFDGVGNFVTNTGNNNNLQGSISITVIVTP